MSEDLFDFLFRQLDSENSGTIEKSELEGFIKCLASPDGNAG